jgi:uncharacterized protein (DUF362 family)
MTCLSSRAIGLTRRELLAVSIAAPLARPERGKTRVALVQSTHKRLTQPLSPEHPLDYARVRDMVWKAIEYGRPLAGSLEAKIRPGSWVVVKPNIGQGPFRRYYRSGDVTDLRVTRAVVEYVARKSRAARITIAEGGNYRRPDDPAADNIVELNGRRVHMIDLDWGAEFPGLSGTIADLVEGFRKEFPGRRFDFADLSYDAVRDTNGGFQRTEVPRTASGVGAFGARPDYFTTNTIRNCDFLVDVPVMKCHGICGITACLKNYVGTAPRQAYSLPGSFSAMSLHNEHGVEGRLDPIFVDLAAFHPPDFSVVDGIRGLQYEEHNNGRSDQMLRNNLVLASEDPVAADTMVARLMGYNPWDMDFLHLAEQRGMGTMKFEEIEVIGDEPDGLRRRWGKPRNWFGRGNREWRITRDPDTPPRSWTPYKAQTDTVYFGKVLGVAPAYAAAVNVRADGRQRAFLWTGIRGRVTARLNGETVMEQENLTRYRVGQFQQEVELRSGENLLVFRVQPAPDGAQLSALLVGPRNDGDTVEGIRWHAEGS